MLDWISGGYTRSSLFHGFRGILASRLSPPPPHVTLGLTRVRVMQVSWRPRPSRPPFCKGGMGGFGKGEAHPGDGLAGDQLSQVARPSRVSYKCWNTDSCTRTSECHGSTYCRHDRTARRLGPSFHSRARSSRLPVWLRPGTHRGTGYRRGRVVSHVQL